MTIPYDAVLIVPALFCLALAFGVNQAVRSKRLKRSPQLDRIMIGLCLYPIALTIYYFVLMVIGNG